MIAPKAPRDKRLQITEIWCWDLGSGMCVCSSHVKVALRHVSGRVDLHASVSGCKLVT